MSASRQERGTGWNGPRSTSRDSVLLGDIRVPETANRRPVRSALRARSRQWHRTPGRAARSWRARRQRRARYAWPPGLWVTDVSWLEEWRRSSRPTIDRCRRSPRECRPTVALRGGLAVEESPAGQSHDQALGRSCGGLTTTVHLAAPAVTSAAHRVAEESSTPPGPGRTVESVPRHGAQRCPFISGGRSSHAGGGAGVAGFVLAHAVAGAAPTGQGSTTHNSTPSAPSVPPAVRKAARCGRQWRTRGDERGYALAPLPGGRRQRPLHRPRRAGDRGARLTLPAPSGRVDLRRMLRMPVCRAA